MAHYHNLTVEETLKKLDTSIKGLSLKTAKARLKEYGKNILPKEKRLSRFSIFLSQFKSPLLYILLIAGAISGFLGEFVDMAVILAAVIINVIIGFLQEDKANRSLEQLKTMVERHALVIRGNHEYEIKAEDLVPGDIVILEEGAKIPADGRIINEKDLEVSEASLTGESAPVEKKTEKIDKNVVLAERINMVYMGTLVTRGKATVVITATGKDSHFGEIASLVRETKEDKTPLQARISKFSHLLGGVILVIAGLLFLTGVLLGRSIFEMFLTSVAVAVASIPEGLPISITVILAIGMQKMSKRKALTRKMVAAETLGSVSVICSDKTGTLTVGQMRVAEISACCGNLLKIKEDGHASRHENLLEMTAKINLLCNNAAVENPKDKLKNWKILGDTTERALLISGYEMGFDKYKLEKKNPRIDEIPFNSERKFMATLNKWDDGKNIILVKGAPEILLEQATRVLNSKESKFSAKEKKQTREKIDRLTAEGLRVLALCYKKTSAKKIKESDIDDLVFVAVVGLKDPLRATAKQTVKLTKDAGIRPVIVTGDHVLTAKAIGKEIGLRVKDENVLQGKDIDNLTDKQLAKQIKKIDVFARVLPKHKLRIIDAWQKKGEVVAMTGDGVNDAPAIKSADIGVALGSGSDVTKEVSDMVLLDDKFGTIIEAVKRGRIVFDNIRKVIVYLLSDSFTEVILIIGALLMGLPLPVTAAQILWVNIIDDSFPGLSLAFDKGESDIMERKPRTRKTPILNSEMKAIIFIVGIVTDIFLLGIFCFVYKLTNSLEYSRTLAFVGLGIDSLFIVYATRSLRHNIWHTKFWNNMWLNFAVLFGVVMLFVVVYVPFLQEAFSTIAIGWREWSFLLAIGMVNLIAIEVVKWIFIHRHQVD